MHTMEAAHQRVKFMVVKFKVQLLTFLFFIIFFSSKVVIAIEIVVEREAPQTVKWGEIFQVNITVRNLCSEEKKIVIEETVGNFEPIEPTPIIIQPNESGPIFVPPPFFRWNFSLEAYSNKTVFYKGRPSAPGDIMLSPTKVYWGGKSLYTEPLTIKVLCNQNKICELDKNENYLTCPQDCPSGSADNYCDMLKDGICDPDCEISADVDCVCNKNGICEKERGETPQLCALDCHCGNGICEEILEENYENCPQDCKFKPPSFSLYIYFIVIVILIGLVFLIIWKSRRVSYESST